MERNEKEESEEGRQAGREGGRERVPCAGVARVEITLC